MKAASKWTLIALALMLGASTSMAVTITNITFGSNNNGDGGFTSIADLGSWTLGTDSMIYTNNFGGRENSGLQGDLSLTPTAGNKYSFSSTFNVVALREAAFNRVALSLFTTNNTVAGLDSGIHLMFLDNETLQISEGINTFATTTNTAWGGAVFGPGGQFTLDGDVSFIGTDAVIDLTLSDYNSYSQTLSLTTAASNFALGGYAGFGMRTRSTPADVVEFQSFSASVEAIPEPSTVSMIALMGSALFLIRRYTNKGA